jgi:hypothetical protein
MDSPNIKIDLNKIDVCACVGSSGSGQWQVAGSSEHGSEP